MNNTQQQRTPSEKLFGDDGSVILEGQGVWVNSVGFGEVYLDSEGRFNIAGWSNDRLIKSLKVIPELSVKH